jgi:hypothetical protein
VAGESKGKSGAGMLCIVGFASLNYTFTGKV